MIDDQRPRKPGPLFGSVTVRVGHSMLVISRIWWLIRHASSHLMLPAWHWVSLSVASRSGSSWLCCSTCFPVGGVVVPRGN